MIFPFIVENDRLKEMVIKHGWLENPYFLRGKSPIKEPFSIAMFDYRKVIKGGLLENGHFVDGIP